MRKFIKAAGLLLMCSSLSLGGCAEVAATAINDARDLHAAGKAYVAETHETRREIRRLCLELLRKEVEQLENDGKYDEARALLKANYPGLVSFEAAKKALKDAEELGIDPYVCESAP